MATELSRLLYLCAFSMLISNQLVSSAFLSINKGRICVGSDVDCTELQRNTGGNLACIATRDRVDCLKKLRSGDVDFGYFEAEDQKIAVLLQEGQDDIKFEVPVTFSSEKDISAVHLLVNNVNNFRPRTLCHPGFHRERFYPRALYTPTTLDTKEPSGDIQSLIVSLSKAWTEACLPGQWSPDPITDRQLKRDHPHLCNLCSKKNCTIEDDYAGSGAIRCLLDNVAEAAFVSDIDLKTERARNPEVEKLYHFCRNKDDPIHTLGDKTNGASEPCDWGRRPPPVLLTRSCDNPKDSKCKNKQQLWLKDIASNNVTVKRILDLPRTMVMNIKETSISPWEIIKQAGYKLEKPKTKDSVVFCVQTQIGLEKCKDLAMAQLAYSADGSTGIKCQFNVNDTNCLTDIYFGNADVITLDGGDVYQATQDHGFERLVSEVYDEAAATPTSSYYAVAVIRTDSNITSFEHLKDRKSCHTGIGKTAGWKIPVATLLEQRLIDPEHCNYVKAMAEYFSKGSCAPGGRSHKYNKQQNYISRLCDLCLGEGEDQCARSNAEPFYSYVGAFRCLVHGGGDVAFVKHTTVPSMIDGGTSATWSIGLRAEQFMLLCPNGGRASIHEYKTCNLALVPAHESVVSGRMSENRKQLVRETLLGLGKVFNADAAGSKTFKLFGAYHGNNDLLFKDSAVNLRALSEDSQEERDRKEDYFKKLKELNTCEVRVCALEDHMHECEAMANHMVDKGIQYVCVSARDRMDCVNRVIRDQVDFSIVPGSYLGINPDLSVIGVVKNQAYSEQEFRYKAVMVVRKSTIKSFSDIRGKKSCHTGYGRTTGWRIPVSLLKRAGIINPICSDGQSTLEHEIASVATTFNRACIPGNWAASPSMDKALKEKYKAMCSMCSSRTCDGNDDYSGYEGALRCLTQNDGDIAFSKLSVVKSFFLDNLGSDSYGLLCRDSRVVDIDSPEAEDCYWASRPWDVFVTHAEVSETKAHQLYWKLLQTKGEGEKDLANREWYFTTLGFQDVSDLIPATEINNTKHYYSKTRMDVVEAEQMCNELPVRHCVTNDEEEHKCNSLRSVLSLRGIAPPLQCVVGRDINECLFRINMNVADLISLNDVQRYNAHQKYKIMNLVSESYPVAKSTLYYLLAVVKKSSNVTFITDLPGKTTCHSNYNAAEGAVINVTLTDCLAGTSDFFENFSDAITCLTGSNKDVAFVKLPTGENTVDEVIPDYLKPDNFQLLCSEGVMDLSHTIAPLCNLGRVPADVVVTRQSESSARQQDMMHLLLTAGKTFGGEESFFRLFFQYFSKKDLLFRDNTSKLVPLPEDDYQTFQASMWQQACHLYDHHLKKSTSLI